MLTTIGLKLCQSLQFDFGGMYLAPRNKDIGAGKFDNVPTATNFLLMQTLCGCSGCPGRMGDLFMDCFDFQVQDANSYGPQPLTVALGIINPIKLWLSIVIRGCVTVKGQN